MRKKIKEIMNKEEGFTLVELLAVLAILAIIVAIAIPAIGNVIEKSETRATAAEIELVKDAARLYEIDTEKELTTDSGVSVADLVAGKYLDLKGDSDISGTVRRSTETEIEKNGTYIFVSDKVAAQ